MLKAFKILLPFIFLFSLLFILFKQLNHPETTTFSSNLIGQTLPNFELQNALEPQKFLSSKQLTGKISLLNIWATWCTACEMEHELLMEIKTKYNIPIYSINYKENIPIVVSWLQKKGNPYTATGIDVTGNTVIDLGIYGTPETFIVDAAGKIIYRHVGALNRKTWLEVLLPLIEQHEKTYA